MSRTAIAIDPVTSDIYLDGDGNLAMVQDAEAIGQHARLRLHTYEGEWYLDTACGVPWLSDVLGQNYDPALAESVVKAELLNTDGVTGIDGFSVSFDRASRGVSIRSITVNTIYDEVATV